MDTVAAVCGSVCEHVPPVRVVVFQRNVMNNFSVSSTTLTPIFTRDITCPTHRTLRSPLPAALRIRTPLRAHLA